MKTNTLLLLLLLTTFYSFSQQLKYNSHGGVYNSENIKLSPNEVRELLADNQNLLKLYNSGRSKKTVGNIFLFGGLGLIAADLASGLFSDSQYPTALTAAGTVFVIIGIPVKIGYSKKIKTVVLEYNKQLVYNEPKINIEDISLLANKNGVGFQITF